MSKPSERLWAYGLFGGVLSATGLPIYIFAPKFYVDTYGVSLGTLGLLLFAMRILDVIQDPVLGWCAERLRKGQRLAIGIAVLGLALGMLLLFAIEPLFSAEVWFFFSATLLFTSFSFLTIAFYARGVRKASNMSGGHLRLAAWREGGALTGVCIAAILPTIFGMFLGAPFAAFAVSFSLVALIAAWGMRREWTNADSKVPIQWQVIVSDPFARRLLLLALVNGAPLAITSTLFLFFVESRLAAPGWEGPLLVLFFLSAAVSSSFWSAIARRIGERLALAAAMGLAIISFSFALTLGNGDQSLFVVICIVSGAATGADITLLPAMFAKRLEIVSPNGGQGFGLWSFVNKFALAFAAVALLPLLEFNGFEVGQVEQNEASVVLLGALYAGVPSLLKLLSLFLLWRLPNHIE